jgi:gluconokinase
MSGAIRVVLCGVAGSGKTTVGRLLAAQMDVAFVDADDFHPPANRDHMASGAPLDDAARAGWLAALHQELRRRAAAGSGFVLACSALAARHRRVLRDGAPGSTFVHLRVPPAVLARRVAARAGHFFPAALLPSQLAAWEELGAAPDDAGFAVDGEQTAADVAAAIARHFAARRTFT